MATVSAGNVGDLVYEVFRPLNPGRIVSKRQVTLLPSGRLGRWLATVRWRNGQTTEVDVAYLQDFQALIEDHRRKYERFAAMVSTL